MSIIIIITFVFMCYMYAFIDGIIVGSVFTISTCNILYFLNL